MVLRPKQDQRGGGFDSTPANWTSASPMHITAITPYNDTNSNFSDPGVANV